MTENHPDKAPMHSVMAMRGVTRPMALHEIMQHHQEMGPPYSSERFGMLQMHHQQTLWIYWTIILLGFWMLVSPFTFDFGNAVAIPAGGRDLWLTLEQRTSVMRGSDIISGILLIIFGWRSLQPNRPYSLWICCFMGIWLTLAPVLFWAPKSAIYLNDTLVGAWIISLTVLIAGMPNMLLFMEMGPSIPQGWSYNPSAWPQRSIMIALGFAGWLVSRYLAAYQMGYATTLNDPFFGEDAVRVLTSDMSRSLPISDAALGTIAYTFECLMGFMGGPARWRTMPWMVALFGILVIPLGLVHIFLVISQPVVVGSWCSFCLLAAAIMLPMIPLEIDEVIAMCQYLKRAKSRGESMAKVFWKGGTEDDIVVPNRSEEPELMELTQHGATVLKAAVWGFSLPWNLFATILLSLWIIFSPLLWPAPTTLATTMQVSGLLAITVAVLALGEVIRGCRYLNILIGLGLAIGTFFETDHIPFIVHNLIMALGIAAFSLPRGMITQRYGTWQKLIS